MRHAAIRAAGAARVAAAAVTMLAVLLLAVSHIEADHAPAMGRQSAVVAVALCHTAPVGAVGTAAECSAPCVAALACVNATACALGLRAEIFRAARKSFSGAEVALATPPPRIG